MSTLPEHIKRVDGTVSGKGYQHQKVEGAPIIWVRDWTPKDLEKIAADMRQTMAHADIFSYWESLS